MAVDEGVCFTMRKFIAVALAAATLIVPAAASASTRVPGHQDKDSGTVMGKYESLYAYDAQGGYYWDLGDGRIYQNVPSVEDLDAATLTTCDYVVVYQGDFGDDPFLDTGWIRNNIHCSGYEPGTYNSLVISEDDHRYTGEREQIWGNWEIMVDTWSGVGNVANPQHPVNQ